MRDIVFIFFGWGLYFYLVLFGVSEGVGGFLGIFVVEEGGFRIIYWKTGLGNRKCFGVRKSERIFF